MKDSAETWKCYDDGRFVSFRNFKFYRNKDTVNKTRNQISSLYKRACYEIPNYVGQKIDALKGSEKWSRP